MLASILRLSMIVVQPVIFAMSISSVLSSGLAGIQYGMARVDRAGGQMAQFGINQNTEQVASAAVDQRIGENQVKLGADVVKVADQMLGTIIDIRA